jgi:hypothetical protein
MHEEASMIDRELSTHEEIEAMLPWFVAGRLSPDDRRRVESYLAAHQELRRELGRIEREAAATVVEAQSLGLPRAAALDRLLAAAAPADAGLLERARIAIEAGLSRLGRAVAALSPRQLGGLAAAALALVAIQAGSLLFLTGSAGNEGTVRYETATGPGVAPSTGGTFAIVSFTPTAAAGEIARVLEEAGVEIVEGPKAGIWRIRLSRTALTPAEASKRLDALRRRPELFGFSALAQ